jgi:hypothetical protein
MLFDLRDSLSARGYLAMAHDSAVAAGDSSLVAAALGHLSFVPASSGQPSAAAEYLNRAVAYADRGAPAGVRSWLFAVASECRANAGESTGALTAIDDAKRSLQRSSVSPQPVWFDYYDESRLGGFEGYALVKAGSPAPAIRILEQAVLDLPRDATKQRAIFRADLAAANLSQGNVHEACSHAMYAATDLRTARYATCVQRLRQLRSRMRPFETSRAVRDLDHAIVDL